MLLFFVLTLCSGSNMEVDTCYYNRESNTVLEARNE